MSEPKISKPVATPTQSQICRRCSFGALSAARYRTRKVRAPSAHCSHSALMRLSARSSSGVYVSRYACSQYGRARATSADTTGLLADELPGSRQQAGREDRLDRVAEQERREAERDRGGEADVQRVPEPRDSEEVDDRVAGHHRREREERLAVEVRFGETAERGRRDDEPDQVPEGRQAEDVETALAAREPREAGEARGDVQQHPEQRAPRTE